MSRKLAPDAAPETEAEPPGFEASFRALEHAVAALESGTLDLDDALATYEKGVQLLSRCQTLLDRAEQKVQQVTGTDPEGGVRIRAFTAGLEESDGS